MGGNIGKSPLDFLDEVNDDTKPARTLLELSSWQIHDLARQPFRPCELVVITPLYPDHQDRYNSIDEYIKDKLTIFLSTQPPQKAVLPYDDQYIAQYHDAVCAEEFWYYTLRRTIPPGFSGVQYTSGTLRCIDKEDLITEISINLPISYLPAICAAWALSIPIDTILDAVSSYEGLSHRREIVTVRDGITFINDSAATIPEAVIFSLNSINTPIHLIAGGTDKHLDPSVMIHSLEKVSSLHLLAGSFTDKLLVLLKELAIPYRGPFSSMRDAVSSARAAAAEDSTIILSPGASSFEYFVNEFDRGDQFKQIVLTL